MHAVLVLYRDINIFPPHSSRFFMGVFELIMLKKAPCGFSETSATLPPRPVGDAVPGTDSNQPSPQTGSEHWGKCQSNPRCYTLSPVKRTAQWQ